MSDAYTKPTPEQIKAQEDRLAAMSDEEIDLSEMPEVGEMSTWVQLRKYPDLASARRGSRERRSRKVAAE